MPRICLLLVAGLDESLLARTPGLKTLASLPHRTPYKPAFPAVTSTAQATLTTGAWPGEHGIICNGLYTHGHPELHPHLDLANHAEVRRQVSFWEQSNALLQRPRFWAHTQHKVAMLFWQNSIGERSNGAADIVLTPKPQHTPDGKTLTACWSAPADLYATLTAQLGPFPLHNYWSPMAGLPSSQWIARSAEYVWKTHRPDLQLVYIPHLDFNLQRLGPNHPALAKDLQDVDALLAPLAAQVRADGGTLIVAGDYAMHDVDVPILPNLALRHAGLLLTKPDSAGKLLVDYDASNAFVMADHQVAFLYAKPGHEIPAKKLLSTLPGVADVFSSQEELATAGLASDRAGTAVLTALPNAWFVHDWWLIDAERPAWQFSVDIHSKPGYDPRELFFDPVRKTIAQDPALVKGSHGAPLPTLLLSDAPVPPTRPLHATHIAPWLTHLLS